jgi:hypothetical protein
MSNSANSQVQDEKSLRTDNIMGEAAEVSPFLLLGFSLIAFIVIATFWTIYYNEVFYPKMGENAFFAAIATAVIQEGSRLAFMMQSVRDFKLSNFVGCGIGAIFSIALLYHDVNVAKDLSTKWDNQDLPILFFIWVTAGIELRLVLGMIKSPKRATQTLVATLPSAASGTPPPVTIAWDEARNKLKLVQYWKDQYNARSAATRDNNRTNFENLAIDFGSRGYVVNEVPDVAGKVIFLDLTMLDGKLYRSDISTPNYSYTCLNP